MENYTDINEIEMLQEDRIMSFLRGEMTQDEESLFKEELQKNPEFKEKAISLARLAKGIKQVGEENDRILKDALLSADETTVRNIVKKVTEVKAAAWESETPVTGQTNSTAKIIPFKKRYAAILSIAASICLIVYLGFQFNEGRKENEYLISLGNQFAVPYQSIGNPEEGGLMRGGDITEEEDDIEKEVKELVNNVYSDKDLDNTLKRLAELWEDSTSDTYSDYSDYAPQIGWALATGYLKNKDKEATISILEEMTKLYDKDTEIGKQVRDLQKRLMK